LVIVSKLPDCLTLVFLKLFIFFAEVREKFFYPIYGRKEFVVIFALGVDTFALPIESFFRALDKI